MTEMKEKRQIVNCHPCIQGEGRSVGQPMILIRTSLCNLNCMFHGSICDSSETSWNHDPDKNALYSLEDVEMIFSQHSHIEKVLLTGGNPSAQPALFKDICELAFMYDKSVEIEDNGTTYYPFDHHLINLVTLSPKLSNSTPTLGKFIPQLGITVSDKHVKRHEDSRKNYASMKKWITRFPYQIKFVISCESDINEAFEVMRQIGANPDNVYFMPEAGDRKQLEANAQWLYERCIELGINYSDRLHVRIYDAKKGV